MNDILYAGMREASRLTRAGRLIDATALLRRVLQSGRDPDPAATPPSIDLAPDTVEVAAAERGRPESLLQAQLPDVLHRSLDRITHTGFEPGPRGLAEPAGADIPVPGGGRFLTKSFTSQAGSRAYKLYVPSQYRGQPLALIVMLHAAPVMPGQAAALPVPTPIRKGRMPLEQCSASFPIIRSISDDRQSANQLYSLDEGFEATLSPAPRTW